MVNWKGLTEELERLLRIRTYAIAYKRLEHAGDLENINKVRKDEELVVALPPGKLEIAIEGLQRLSAVGLRYPIPIHGAECDPGPALSKAYPGMK